MGTTITNANSQAVDPALLEAMNPKKSDGKSTIQEAQDRFMTLLVTQMKNQDPLNPLDNAQVTSQLAQLSTVTGIDKLNETMLSMSNALKASQGMQYANMIGHGVVVEGKNVELKDGKSILGFDLPQPADRVKVKIKNEAGSIVQTVNVDASQVGYNSFAWDGKTATGQVAPNGSYTFEVEAMALDKKLSVTTYSYGIVNSVAMSAQGTNLLVGNVGQVPATSVKQIF